MECKHFRLNREGEEGEYEILILMTNVSKLQIKVQYRVRGGTGAQNLIFGYLESAGKMGLCQIEHGFCSFFFC